MKKHKQSAQVVALGVFDGVHLGHQALLRALTGLAKRTKSQPIALTFLDHPEHVIRKSKPIPYLLPRQQTFELLLDLGADEVHFLPFTKAFSRQSPLEFIYWLLLRYNLKGVVVGTNFRFGKGAKGNVALLKREGERLDFKVVAVPPVKRLGGVVSSSRIRELLQTGKVEQANQLLGRPYELDGLVAHGKHVGHKIGFPTANLSQIPQVLPKDGVYACLVPIGKRVYRAGMNLGHRPTFKDDDHHRSAEVHMVGYKGNLYGKSLSVRLMKYLRPEIKFKTPDLLAKQIFEDLCVVLSLKVK